MININNIKKFKIDFWEEPTIYLFHNTKFILARNFREYEYGGYYNFLTFFRPFSNKMYNFLKNYKNYYD